MMPTRGAGQHGRAGRQLSVNQHERWAAGGEGRTRAPDRRGCVDWGRRDGGRRTVRGHGRSGVERAIGGRSRSPPPRAGCRERSAGFAVLHGRLPVARPAVSPWRCSASERSPRVGTDPDDPPPNVTETT
jgi:hypothetical protein